jgi:hypothetical protein
MYFISGSLECCTECSIVINKKFRPSVFLHIFTIIHLRLVSDFEARQKTISVY